MDILRNLSGQTCGMISSVLSGEKRNGISESFLLTELFIRSFPFQTPKSLRFFWSAKPVLISFCSPAFHYIPVNFR